MKFWYLFFAVSLLLPNSSNAVVKRHDMPAEKYVVENAPEFLIDMPHEGHGVLIASQWIVTAAHVIFYDYTGKSIKIAGESYTIESVTKHPDYIEPDESLFKGDAARLMTFFTSRSDIALIKLSSPVSGIAPVKIYQENNEVGQIVTVFGRGATGNGLIGEDLSTKPLRKMHSFHNKIDGAKGNWLTYKFDSPPNSLPLEGMHGSGDSGGPSVIFLDGEPYLAGLSSWQYWQGDLSKFKGGLYGATGYQVRLSVYKDWILGVLAS
jgi:hypothetical protein